MLLREISHDMPTGYMASDAFQNANLAEYTKYTGFYYKYPIYYNNGIEDAINAYYPAVSYLTVILSNFSGLETYNAITMTVYIVVIMSALLFLFVIRDRRLAVLSAPLLLFLFLNKFQLGFFVGTWSYMVSASLSVGFLWVLKSDLKFKHIIMAILTASMFLSHLTDAIAVYLVVFVYLLFERFKSLKFSHFILTLFVAILLSSLYLHIFIPHSIGLDRGKGFIVFNQVEPQFYSVSINDLELTKFVVYAGMLVSLIFFRRYKYLFLIGIIMFFLYTFPEHIDGTLHSMYQARNMFLPIFLSFFFGIVIMLILGLFKIKNFGICYVITIAVMIIILINNYSIQSSPGIMNNKYWRMYKWLEQNTEEDADLFYTYHEAQDQTNVFFFSKRKSWRIRIDNYINASREGYIYRDYYLFFSAFLMQRWISFFELQDIGIYSHNKDICNFDYIIINAESRLPQIGEYINFYSSLLRERFIYSPICGSLLSALIII
jgi:hypothetical protein